MKRVRTDDAKNTPSLSAYQYDFMIRVSAWFDKFLQGKRVTT